MGQEAQICPERDQLSHSLPAMLVPEGPCAAHKAFASSGSAFSPDLFLWIQRNMGSPYLLSRWHRNAEEHFTPCYLQLHQCQPRGPAAHLPSLPVLHCRGHASPRVGIICPSRPTPPPTTVPQCWVTRRAMNWKRHTQGILVTIICQNFTLDYDCGPWHNMGTMTGETVFGRKQRFSDWGPRSWGLLAPPAYTWPQQLLPRNHGKWTKNWRDDSRVKGENSAQAGEQATRHPFPPRLWARIKAVLPGHTLQRSSHQGTSWVHLPSSLPAPPSLPRL